MKYTVTIEEYKRYRKGNEIATRRLRRVIRLSRIFEFQTKYDREKI